MPATRTPSHRTRKTSTRPHHRLRLPRLGWGWTIVALTAYGVAKTWPILTSLTIALIGALLILRAIRPRRLAPLLNRIGTISLHRPALPNRRTLEQFHRMTPTRFEQAIAELAAEHPDVAHAKAVGQANDRGADVLVTLHNGRRILIQCKHYKPGNNVGSDTVQTINGVYRDIHHCHTAAVVTTAGYTRAAYETTAMLPQPIRLIDGIALTAWANGTGPTPWT